MTAAVRVDFSTVAVLRSAGLPAAWLGRTRCDEHARAVDGDAGARRAAAGAVAAADAGLARVADEPAFRLAVASASPRVHDTTLVPFAGGERRKRRQRRRALAALLQRLAAKNDTANGYGPMDRLEFGGAEVVAMPAARPGECEQRSGTLSWWFVQQLAARVAADPAIGAQLPSRLHSLVVLEGDRLRIGGRSLRLPAAAAGQLRSGPAALDDRQAAALERSGVLRRDLLVPPAVHDPAAWLSEELAGLRGGEAARWRDAVDGLRARARELAGAPAAMRAGLLGALESACAALVPGATDRAPQRRFYADRTVVFEEGRGAAAPYRVGGALHRRLREQLCLAAEVASVYGYQRFLDAAKRLRAELGGQPANLVDVSRAADAVDARGAQAWEGPRAPGLRRALTAAVEADGTLAPELVRTLLEGFARPAVTLASPDVLLRRPPGRAAGDAEAVLGELHAGLQVMGPLEHFWRGDRLWRWAGDGLAAAGHPLWQIVAPRSQGKAFGQRLPVPSVCYEADAGDASALRFADVKVTWRGDEPWLEGPGGTEGQLVPTDPDNPLYRALSPCAAEFPHLDVADGPPEVRLGDLTVQRPRWRVPLSSQPGPDLSERWIEARRLRCAGGLPEQVFVRLDGVRKPFFVDFRDPLLADVFWHWTRGHHALVATAAAPDLGELWLERAGQRFCSEIRCSLIMSKA